MKIYLFIVALLISKYSSSQENGFANSIGVQIHYKTFGKGEPILIINGGPGMNSEGFNGLAKDLAKNNQTIIYDQRGTGASIMDHTDSSTITMELMLQDIEALRQHLRIDKWIVLGHSFGGMLGSYYTSRYPDRVKALILSSSGGIDLELLSLLNINSRLSKQDQDSLNFWEVRIANGDTTYHARLERGTFLAPAYVYYRENIPIIAVRLTQGNSKINSLMWSDMRKIHFDCAEDLKYFKHPALIIQGEQDVVDKKLAFKAARVLPGSKVVFLDHCGHYGWLDNRERYLSEINHFLAVL